MTRDKDKQAESAAKQQEAGTADQRQERLRAALRANLRRRKEQSRGRSDAESDRPTPPKI